MAKKKSAAATSKAATKAAKKAKAAQKVDKKEKKKVSKGKGGRDGGDEEDDDDLEGILDRMRREWEQAHSVTEELVEGPPSRRANATLTACPNGNHLWCIGGEFFSDDGKAYFYNDVFRYSPDKDEWRKFVSPTCPGPRSAHSVVATAAAGGKLFLFGGEFSSLYQNNFHHYRDFWCFDIPTHSWERLETKLKPSARSGHRMAMWKHYIVLFGGFYDPGYRTNYLNDTWLFDTQEYKWRQIEFRETDRKPSPRSGFSLLSTADGVILHGGYCKEYVKGKRPVGVMLDDTWFLRISSSPDTESTSQPLVFKWEKRKKSSTAYAPSLRSGCTMALWSAKGMGILFGGVTDEDTDEESLQSVFWNDLYGYQLAGNGRWISMALKQPKKKGSSKKKAITPASALTFHHHDDSDDAIGDDLDADSVADSGIALRQKSRGSGNGLKIAQDASKTAGLDYSEDNPDDPNLTAPMPRYNTMLAVLRNTLYIYGGIFERGSREYTLDDFYALQLDKLDRYTCLKRSDVVIPVDEGESSSDDEDDEDDDDDKYSDRDGDFDSENGGGDAGNTRDGDIEVADDAAMDAESVGDSGAQPTTLRARATEFMGVASKDTERSAEDIIGTPLPGETLAMFYARSREYWTQKAHNTSDNRGKQLRRDGFSLAEDRYAAYKPILEEVEKILAEAGLDEEEMKMGTAREVGGSGAGQSRNRR
ncbi:galactose oxidase [Hygrophoropsis aurantiaca]|uniref:Galactose oxidase n=1 Tax=Hygrophoropsis aurantiaca TaxID=72124 RepID=A0ACB8AHW3_9AGAM|nr:galactose oxidase [Hygrophoropsis aurantiaca]